MKVTYTNELNKLFLLLHGKSGMGKTPLAATAPKPIFIDVEKRMISVRSKKIPRIEADSMKEVRKAIKFLKNSKEYQTVILDSLSQLAQNRFKVLKKRETSNKYEKYEDLYDDVIEIIDLLTELPQNVICICKTKPTEIDGAELYRPLFPGRALGPEIPYLFDMVFALVPIGEDDESEEGFSGKVLLTKPTELWEAKSPDMVDKLECFDLSKIFKKVLK